MILSLFFSGRRERHVIIYDNLQFVRDGKQDSRR